MGDLKVRQGLFSKLTSLLTTVKAHPTKPLTLFSSKALLERSCEVMKQCEEVHRKIIAVCADDDAVLVQEEAFEPIETVYIELVSQLHQVIEELQVANPASSSAGASASTVVNVKLPAIELPTFDGSFANWTSFKDLFLATVGNNTSLAPAQKLQYLKSALQNEPAALLKPIPVTDSNYKDAWDLLLERYENEREIVHSLINKLLFHKALQSESAYDLQKLIDNTIECTRALRVLKQSVDTWDSILVVVCVNKLDSATRREWAIRQTGTQIPTFKDFSTFITNHIRGLLATGASTAPEKRTYRGGGDRTIRAHHTSAEITCSICKGSHLNYKCKELISKTPAQRNSIARRMHLCFNCLSRDHQCGECNSKSTCRKCGELHHTLLHNDQQAPHAALQRPRQPSAPAPQAAPSGSAPSNGQPGCENPSVDNRHISIQTQVLLATAIVKVRDSNGVFQPIRIFLDSGSEGTFISDECVKRLGLKRQYSRVTVTGLSHKELGTTKGKVSLTLYNYAQGNLNLNVEAHILPQITGQFPKAKCKHEEWAHIQGIQLADPRYFEPSSVDFLLGGDYVASIMRCGKRQGPANTPIAQETLFGWILSGRVQRPDSESLQTFHVCTDTDLTHIIQRFWEIEEPPRKLLLTSEEKLCEQHFIQNYNRREDGRFVVGVPFNDKKVQLGGSRTHAINRLRQVERRLNRYSQHKQQYIDFMREYEELGHMERIPPEEAQEVIGKTNYLPHHFVVNDSSSTTKLRVVFDGSAKTTSGISLNEALLVGATVQDELYILLLRFRMFPVVLKADIAKMFRQFLLRPEDAEFHRIVWRESPDQAIADFRLRTVTYGTACAPFLSTRCLQQLATDSKEKYPEAAKALSEDAYVDDLLSGGNDSQSVITLYQQLSSAVGEAGMELRKWSSNDPKVLEAIPPAFRETDPQSFDTDQSIKALGVQWIPASDSFVFKHVNFSEKPIVTKRSLLSDLAKVFDPLGFISPVTVRAKLLLQELWKLSIEWDQPVPEHVHDQWDEYKEDLKLIDRVVIPRLIAVADSSTYELHGFADASEKAYGCVVYFRVVSPDKTVHVNLITSKTRVAPLKQQTLPRLELCAAVLLAELMTYVKSALKLSCDMICWSDSTITLRWISSQPRRWKTFVANRVAQIHELTGADCWKHVPGVENPADLPSRGMSVKDICESDLWWRGPHWLSASDIPIFIMPLTPTEDTEERNLPVLLHFVQTEVTMLDKYSSLTKLKRVTAHILRLAHNGKRINLNNRRTGPLTAAELQNALMVWVKIVQRQHFDEELDCLSRPSNKKVKTSSKLKQLNPYIDQMGVMRVGGRLENADIPEFRKHQIILPSESKFTTLLVHHYHVTQLHAGFQLTLAAIQAEYWVLRGRDKIRHLIRRCCICRRQRAQTAEQLMGNLPAPRVCPSRPFLHTGVDYAGPFQLKNPIGRVPQTYKGYICLFVCLATKALHLVPVGGLSTDAFLAALRRFVSRRGLCAHIYSDCGTNFVGAERELRAIVKLNNHNSKVKDEMASSGIAFHFNPPSSPHFGGLWESAVKSTKMHLRKVLGNSRVTYEQFDTILCQIEAVLNSRPMYTASSDPGDISALTPGHFLIGEPLTTVPDANLEAVKPSTLNEYQLQQQRVQHFWRRWTNEYLSTLQQRRKWIWEKGNVKSGDLVVIKEDTAPGTWRLGRIVNVHPGTDGKVRVATVKTATTEIMRPIVKLIPLLETDD